MSFSSQSSGSFCPMWVRRRTERLWRSINLHTHPREALNVSVPSIPLASFLASKPSSMVETEIPCRRRSLTKSSSLFSS
ncbi:hypothetical protein DPMN_098383 [Dreissena polymorpha]|uniref:Uncharacterized protein n=1 Tax=Dreissena polymorpha TaxID=45954 RepID=A0A9D4LDL0_DREPO|nr:hypothetical protein DPMN_098383 [Dreissena polymorpha]